MRKGRNPEGIRLSNGTLKTKVDSWQRIIRNYYKDVDSSLNLINPDHKIRSFNVFSDPQLLRLQQALDHSMMRSANEGFSMGMLKSERSVLKPKHIQSILQLFHVQTPEDIEYAFIMTVMMQLGVRSGSELRNMN